MRRRRKPCRKPRPRKPEAEIPEQDIGKYKEETALTSGDKHSESESENSQRSSTDRDFEMVDPGDLEPDETPPKESSN